MKPEIEPKEVREQTELRLKIRSVRDNFFGSYEKASSGLGFNKNTIASYEKGLTLPDIDFLFVFADRTGTDINELIRLRLACSRYETVRALVGSIQQVEKPAPVAPNPAHSAPEQMVVADIFGDGGRSVLEATLRVGEYKIRNDQVTPQVIEAGLAGGPSWIKGASAFPDLDMRMRAMISTFEFMKAAGL
jgi:transcriptional regulator with XRE-family HTH domain